MKRVLKERRFGFNRQCFKYLRYVLNDHFVLVLLFLMGFVMVQYSQLLTNFPKQTLLVYLVLIMILCLLLSLGNIGTYFEKADKVFLLVKEDELISWLMQAKRKAFMVWTSVQTVLLMFLAPVFMKLHLGVLGVVGVILGMAIAKWFVFLFKSRMFFENGRFSWDRAITYESNRQQAILKFYALFTNVKGITYSVKRRAYLDRCLKVIPFKQSQTWSNLYARALLRSSDYLGLLLRLFCLSLLVALFVSNRLLAAALILIFDYLLIFQLLSLYHHYDYQMILKLYPISSESKGKNLHHFLSKLLYFLVLCQLIFLFSWQGIILLVAVSLVIGQLYLPYKIKKMID